MSEVTNQPESQQPEVAGLTLNDLLIALNTIQAVAQRGAIRAEEMSTVGGLHDRLFRFLDSQGAIKRQPTATETPASTEPAADAPASN